MTRRAGLRGLSAAVLAVAIFAAHPRALLAAPKILGPNKCSSCHDHEKQGAWSAKDTHAKALQQLEDKKAAGYAKAIGLADPYDLKGTCVSCHATIFNGDANSGVSCESCHGPGSDYVQPHQEKGAYAKALTLGMFDTRGNLPVWAKMCVDCHLLKDAKLIAAGDTSGADFDVGTSSQKIMHWVP
ncbi:MAG: multiheme c-type cytochrome, partial [Acidobacteriota bacterium]